MIRQAVFQFSASLTVHLARQHVQTLLIRRDLMCLESVRDLYAVLDVSQKHVCVRELVAIVGGQKAERLDDGEALQRARVLEKRFPAAVDELQSLGDEFNLSNAAFAKLHVSRRGIRAFQVFVDAALDAADLLEHADVHRPAVHERAYHFHEVTAQGGGTRAVPGFDKGLPLPRLAPGFVVDLAASQRIGQCALRTFGPEARVDPEHMALFGIRRHQGDEAPGQMGEKLMVGDDSLRSACNRVFHAGRLSLVR